MNALRALTLALALAATPAFAQSTDPLARFARPAADARARAEGRAGDWLAQVDGLPEVLRYRLLGDEPSRRDLRRAALARYERALAARPDDAHVLGAAAQLRERLGDHDGALRDAQRSLELDPDGADAQEAHFTLAIVHTHRHEHAAARDHYLASLTLPMHDRARAVVLGNLADELMALGDLGAALSAYEAGVALRPDFAMGWLGLGITRDRARLDAAAATSRAVRAASDDVIGRIRSPRTASGFDPEALIDALSAEGVFYVPEYDRDYYEGMAHEAVARAWMPGNPFEVPPDDARARRHRELARAAWARYLDRSPADDPWRARATAHLQALGAARR